MRPAVTFPWEDELSSRAPQLLIARDDLLKTTALALFRAPDFAPLAGHRLGNSNGPWLPIAPRAERQAAFRRRNAKEGDLAAVGRPGRLLIRVHTGVEIDERFSSRVITPDESVVTAAADERQLRTIGRPAQFARLAARMNQLLRLRAAGELREPDLALENKGDVVSLGGDRRRVTLTEELLLAALERERPDALLDSLRRTLRIGIRPVQKFKVASARVNNHGCVGSPVQLAEILAVVIVVGSHLPRLIAAVRRRFGHPKVARTSRIEYPGDAAFCRRRGQLGRERSAHHLFQCERLLR